jgi:putative PEP-CTERM system TPR-repeat lipoprotein
VSTSNVARTRRQCRRSQYWSLLILSAGVTGAFLSGSIAADAALEAPAQHGVNSQVNPPGLTNLLHQASQAISQGQFGVAVIYLKNAADLAPQNGGVHAELGIVMLKQGDAMSAEREFRAARHFGVPDTKILPYLFDAMLAHNEQQQLLDQFPAPAPGDRSAVASIILTGRAVALSKTGQPQLADAALDQVLTIDRSAANLAKRAQFAYQQGDRALAGKLTDEALSKAPTNFDALALKISLLQSSNQANQALAVANSALIYFPKDPRALLARFGVYLQLNQDGKASADLDRILDAHPNLPVAVYYKAVLKERAKDFQGAWSIAQTLAPEFVRSTPQIGLAVGQMAINAGHAESGTATLSSIVVKFPTDVNARIRLAAQYLQLKDSQHALTTLQPLLDSSDPRAMALFGQAYAMQKQFSKSTEYFEKASVGGFGGDVLKRQIAASNLQTGNIDAAIQEFQELNAKEPGKPEIAGPLIAALLRKGDTSGAHVVADKLAAIAPKIPYGPFFQGQLLSAGGDLDGAVAAFSRALVIDPKFVPALYDRAVANAQRGNLDAANADLKLILTIDPKNLTALIKSSENELRLGQPAQAQALLQRGVAANPKDVAANLALATFFVTQHRMNDASAAIAKLLSVLPNNPNALAMQGEIALAAGQAPKAIATFRALEKSYPQSPQIQTLLAGALAVQKDTKGALNAYEKTVQLAPTLPSARTALIRYALSINDSATALSAARDYVAQAPGPESDAVLAVTLLALKNKDEAKAVLNKSLAQHPSPEVLLALSQITRQEGNAAAANKLLSDWLKNHSNDIAVRLQYAQVLMQGAPAEAEQQFLTVVKQQPYNVIALNNLAWLLKDKSPQQALAYADRAAKLAPTSSSILDTLAEIKVRLKDNAGALPLLQRAHQTDQKDPEITYHLVMALDSAGRRDEAKKTLAALLASALNFDDRNNALALSQAWR